MTIVSEPKITSTVGFIWKLARKTQEIRAKAMVNLITDRWIICSLLINTLEEYEPIDVNNILCLGPFGDAWQQTSEALLKKYDVKEIDEEGWMICEPKPENKVEFFETTTDGFIQGLWGSTINGVDNLQHFNKGDFICRQVDDNRDQWVVNRIIFLNTYSQLT